jgi:hypothetical protein
MSTDAEVTAAMSAHNTAANGHIGRGTTGNRPASPSIGDTYFDTTLAALILYKSGGWEKVTPDPAPQIASISPSTAATTGTTITITGSSFKSGLSVQFIGADATAYNSPVATFVGATTITATTPALSVANEPYDIKVINNDNQSAILQNALDAGGSPTWNTASGTLATIVEQTALSSSVSATDPDGTSIVYSSSNLPAWVTLNSSTGALTGTAPDIASNTTYSFDVTASDGVNTSSRAFNVIVNALITVDFLVVAGGGSGGTGHGGGGGAGGYRTGSLNLSGSTAIVVGGGGVAGGYVTSTGSLAGNSQLGSIYATAGGNGGAQNMPSYRDAGAGGSGGGGAYTTDITQIKPGASGNAGGYSPVEGYAGGTPPTVQWVGAGGGGSSGVGTYTGNVGGGGPGTANSITGSSITYAAGGNGANPSDNTGGSVSGSANTGNGGGGSRSETAGNGGSGVVIIAYPNTSPAITTITGTLTYDQPTRSGYRVYRFTGGTGTVTF